MTTALAVTPPRDMATGWVNMLGPASDLANAIGNTAFVPTALRGKPAEITAAILTGYELGVGPMTALSQIAIIEGRPTLYAVLMRALVLARGHSLWFEENTSTKVVCAGHRRGEQEVTRITWSIQRARDAGLAGKNTWKQHPQAMLEARASAELCRLVFAECLAGLVHAAEEIQDGEPDFSGGDAPGTGRTTRRRPQVQATIVDGAATTPPERPQLPGESTTDTAPAGSGAAGGTSPNDTAPPPPSSSQSPAMKRLHTLFRQVGVTDRGDRMAVTALILERQVASSKDLTDEELDQVSNRLVDVVEKRVRLTKTGETWAIA